MTIKYTCVCGDGLCALHMYKQIRICEFKYMRVWKLCIGRYDEKKKKIYKLEVMWVGCNDFLFIPFQTNGNL